MGILTDADQRLLPAALRGNNGYHLATQWYLNDWQPQAYQWTFHHVPIPNCTFIAGIASGKTTSTAASYLIDCLSIPYFKALNTSVTAKQAELAFDMVMGWSEGNDRIEHLIDDITLRPYPTITFKNFASYEFRTAGKDAKFIRGHEYDRINYDEAGLDYDGNTIKVLRGRLRGERPNHTKRMCRLDVITSPTDAPWLRERFDRGWPSSNAYLRDQYLSLRVSTYDNKALTPESVALMEAEYPPEMIDVELRGMFPDYGYGMFPSSHIQACTDLGINDFADEALHPEDPRDRVKPGFSVMESQRHGITHFELPADPRRMYIVAGDPGQDNPPKRNAGVVIGWDVTTKPYKQVFFDWVAGKGSYMPWIQSLKYAIEKYNPVFRGIDSTGTQVAIDELAFENAGIETTRINFGRDKDAMLNSLSITLSNHELSMPMIQGNQKQLSQYSRTMDKEGHPQDIVMAQAMCAYLARYTPEEAPDRSERPTRSNYYNKNNRTTTGVSR
jgi:hypothetical protein